MTSVESDVRARKRAEILEVARRRFIAEGYAGAGMEAIARDAAISTATLYDQFSSKAELFRCVAAEAVATLSGAAEAAAGARGERSSALLNAFALGYARLLTDPAAQMLIRVFAAEPRRFAAEAREFWTRGREAFASGLTALVEQLGGEGRLFAANPVAAAGQLLGMVEHTALVGPVLAGEAVPPPRLLEQACAEAVATFLARYGSRAEAEAA
jgi:AcrR family transcriptional regulator